MLAQALLASLVLVVFWAISLHNLTVVPRVYEDEPWQASTGWKIATRGTFGSDVFAGFYGMENRYYGYMPLHPLLLAFVFRFAGLGLFQARFEPVAMGLITLALTYSLARRLFGDSRIGLLAILFLVSIRLTGLTDSQVSGIPLLDFTRIARYDMVVPVFGLASLHAYLTARSRRDGRWYGLAGILAGLAGLAHVYGAFWLPVLLLLAVWDGDGKAGGTPDGGFGGRLAPMVALVLGFVLPWLPYIAYVLGDIGAWRGQTRAYGDRFGLFNLSWYLDNLRLEARRYGPGLGPLRPAVLLRAGFWSALVVLPLSLGALAWRGFRGGDYSARVVVVSAAIFPLLFAALIRMKLANYTVTIAPLGAIAAAWGGVTLWSWLHGKPAVRWARPLMLALLLACVGEGGARVAALEAAASTTTPYYDFIRQVRRTIPPGSRVLGLHNYWFGLEDFDYRSFIVPLSWIDSRNQPRPLPFDEGLELVAPDIVLVDARMREYFEVIASADDENPGRFYHWLNRHDGELLGRVTDSTYGLMEIYHVRRQAR